jgi:two-component system LytT family response regulator
MIRIVVVDDERPAREVIKSFLKGMEGVEVAGEAENGARAVEIAEALHPDLVVMDVQMPVMNGIQAAAALPEGTGIIFVTAFDNYAIKAFELHAFDYILKPVMKPRLREAVARFVSSRRGGDIDRARSLEKSVAKGGAHSVTKSLPVDRLTIRTMFEYMVIKVEDISLIKVEGGLVFVYAAGIKYSYEASLKRVEEKLDPLVFIRVHRNAVVNKNRVKRIFPWQAGRFKVELDDGESVEVSRDNLRRFKEAMGWDI